MVEKEKNPPNKSIGGLKASVIAQGANLLLTILKSLLFTFFIAPEYFGIITLSLAFTGIIQLLNDLGFSTYIIQKENIEQGELASINTTLILLGTGAFLLTCAMAFPIAQFYNAIALYWIMPITGLQFIANSFTLVPIALMRKNMEFGNIGKIQVISNFLSILIGLLLLLFIRDYWVLLAISSAYFIFQLVLTFHYSQWNYQFSNPFRNKISRTASTFGTRLTIFNIITFLSVNLDNFIIAKIAGSSALGLYGKSYDFGVANLERSVRHPVGQVYFSDISGKAVETKCGLFFQYLFLIVSALILIAGPVLLYLDWAVSSLLSQDWQPLIVLLPPFLLSSFIWMSMSMADELLVATFRTKRYLILGIIKAIIGAAAIIIASFWGIKAIAWSFFVYHAILFIPFCGSIFYGIGLEKFKAKSFLLHLIGIVASALILVLLPYLLLQYQVLNRHLGLACFAVGGLFVFYKVWPNLKGYDDFRAFMKALISNSNLVIGKC